MFRSTMIDEAGQEIEANVILDDSMFASFTEKNFEDVGFVSWWYTLLTVFLYYPRLHLYSSNDAFDNISFMFKRTGAFV